MICQAACRHFNRVTSMGKSIIALKNVNRLIENRKLEIVFQMRFVYNLLFDDYWFSLRLTFRWEYPDLVNLRWNSPWLIWKVFVIDVHHLKSSEMIGYYRVEIEIFEYCRLISQLNHNYFHLISPITRCILNTVNKSQVFFRNTLFPFWFWTNWHRHMQTKNNNWNIRVERFYSFKKGK